MTTAEQAVLVVDDDYRVAAIHAAYVERVPGYRVVGQAHSAAEALASAHALHPDLILLDIYLPDGSGIDVARTLLAEPAPPTVLIISAARDMASVREAVALGAIHYLIKPFGFEALAARLAGHRQRSERIAALPEEPDQTDIDSLFGVRGEPDVPQRPSDRRLSRPTLELIYRAVSAHATSMSASEVAEAVGVSRTTAQRYLTYLLEVDVLTLELRYGSAGRPEHRFSINPRRRTR